MSRLLIPLVFVSLIGVTTIAAHAAGNETVAGQASFSVTQAEKEVKIQTQSVVATIKDHPMDAKNYQVLELHFYNFPLTQEDTDAAKRGDIKAIDKKIYDKNIVADYNTSNAVAYFNVDRKTHALTQADISVPGYTCTVAWKPEDIAKFQQGYALDETTVKMKSTDTYNCEMGSTHALFQWSFAVDSPLYPDTTP